MPVYLVEMLRNIMHLQQENELIKLSKFMWPQICKIFLWNIINDISFDFNFGLADECLYLTTVCQVLFWNISNDGLCFDFNFYYNYPTDGTIINWPKLTWALIDDKCPNFYFASSLTIEWVSALITNVAINKLEKLI